MGAITDKTTGWNSHTFSEVETHIKGYYGNYLNMDYGVSTDTGAVFSNSSTNLSINGTKPVLLITTSSNITSITLSQVIPDMHSCHLFITASSNKTVTLQHGATMITGYTSVHPDAGEISLNIAANGYVEIDFLRIGTKIYVRGI